MSNCGAIIVSKEQEGSVAADWIARALNQQGDFEDVEVRFRRNRNGNYVIKIDFGRLGLNQSMGAARDKLEELANKKVVLDAVDKDDDLRYGMVGNIQIEDITIQVVNGRSRSMSR